MSTSVGTLRESSLHASLKVLWAEPGDRVEEQVDGYWVDVVRGEQLIEIQTGSFSALRPKLRHFLPTRRVRVVLPLAAEKHIVRVAARHDGWEQLARRRSPRRERDVDLFAHLVHLTAAATMDTFSLELALVAEEELWLDDGRGSWRRRGVSVVDRRLLEVRQRREFHHPRDYLGLLPEGLPEPFSVRDLEARVRGRRGLAGKMAYTLRTLGVLEVVGKRGNALLYAEVGQE